TLFVLVMMFMPEGLTGLFSHSARLLRRHGLWRLLPLAFSALLAVALLAAGAVFLVEMVQRVFSQDYRALARMRDVAPPLLLFGRSWSATALITWLTPLGLSGTGLLMTGVARRCQRALAADSTPSTSEKRVLTN